VNFLWINSWIWVLGCHIFPWRYASIGVTQEGQAPQHVVEAHGILLADVVLLCGALEMLGAFCVAVPASVGMTTLMTMGMMVMSLLPIRLAALAPAPP
jgi:hypothetical protein